MTAIGWWEEGSLVQLDLLVELLPKGTSRSGMPAAQFDACVSSQVGSRGPAHAFSLWPFTFGRGERPLAPFWCYPCMGA